MRGTDWFSPEPQDKNSHTNTRTEKFVGTQGNSLAFPMAIPLTVAEESIAPPVGDVEPPQCLSSSELDVTLLQRYRQQLQTLNYDSLAVAAAFLEYQSTQQSGTEEHEADTLAKWPINHDEIIQAYGGTNCAGLALRALSLFPDGCATLLHSTKNGRLHAAVRVPFEGQHPEDRGIVLVDPGLHLSPVPIRKSGVSVHYFRQTAHYFGYGLFHTVAPTNHHLGWPDKMKPLVIPDATIITNITHSKKEVNKTPRYFYDTPISSDTERFQSIGKSTVMPQCATNKPKELKLTVVRRDSHSFLIYDVTKDLVTFVASDGKKTDLTITDSNFARACAILGNILHAPKLADAINTVYSKKETLLRTVRDTSPS